MPSADRSVLIVVQFEFAAAHSLPHHSGKCRRPHGHNYLLEVGVKGRPRPADGTSSEGMVMDFADLKRTVGERAVAVVDHQDLNQVLPAGYQPATAEHLCLWLWDTLHPALAELNWVRVWETPKSYAEVGR